jgi:hypothetical protein
MTMKQIISNHSGKIFIGAFVLMLALGNYYYRWYLEPPVPQYKSKCEKEIAELDQTIKNQYGTGALRVLNLRDDAQVTENEINVARSIRRNAVQLLQAEQQILCLEDMAKARQVMKMR